MLFPTVSLACNPMQEELKCECTSLRICCVNRIPLLFATFRSSLVMSATVDVTEKTVQLNKEHDAKRLANRSPPSPLHYGVSPACFLSS